MSLYQARKYVIAFPSKWEKIRSDANKDSLHQELQECEHEYKVPLHSESNCNIS